MIIIIIILNTIHVIKKYPGTLIIIYYSVNLMIKRTNKRADRKKNGKEMKMNGESIHWENDEQKTNRKNGMHIFNQVK